MKESEKKAANRICFGETVGVRRGRVRMLLKERLPEIEKAYSRTILKRPARRIYGAGRITVDAREKD